MNKQELLKRVKAGEEIIEHFGTKYNAVLYIGKEKVNRLVFNALERRGLLQHESEYVNGCLFRRVYTYKAPSEKPAPAPKKEQAQPASEEPTDAALLDIALKKIHELQRENYRLRAIIANAQDALRGAKGDLS